MPLIMAIWKGSADESLRVTLLSIPQATQARATSSAPALSAITTPRPCQDRSSAPARMQKAPNSSRRSTRSRKMIQAIAIVANPSRLRRSEVLAAPVRASPNMRRTGARTPPARTMAAVHVDRPPAAVFRPAWGGQRFATAALHRGRSRRPSRAGPPSAMVDRHGQQLCSRRAHSEQCCKAERQSCTPGQKRVRFLVMRLAASDSPPLAGCDHRRAAHLGLRLGALRNATPGCSAPTSPSGDAHRPRRFR